MPATPPSPQAVHPESGVFLGATGDTRLVLITGAIADAITREQVFEAVVDQVAAALGASSAALWLVNDDDRAELARAVGYPEARVFESASLGGQQRFPALDCMRSGAPLWIASQQELLVNYPELAGVVTPGRNYRISCLPLVAQGVTLGSIAFTFDHAPPLDAAERQFLMLVARYTVQALERLRCTEVERQLRTQAEAARFRAELLYSLAESVIRAPDLDTVLSAALDCIQRALQTDRAAILTFDDEGVMRFRAFRGLSDAYRRAVEGHSPWRRNDHHAEPLLVRDVGHELSLVTYALLFRHEGIGALAFVPLIAGGAVVGKFMVYYAEPRELAPAEVEMARGIANHIAAAVARFAAVEELQRTIRFNETFTGILGHDLRNPLGAILNATQLAASASSDERVTRPLARIRTSGERMARMIDQLLDFTRVRVGHRIPLCPAPADIEQIVRQVTDELETGRSEPRVELELEGSYCSGIWDADRLCQVFSNLVANALQHGEPERSVRVRVDTTDPLVVRVEVQNDGAVPPELLEKIFEPMTGGDHRHDRSHGLGLGLYISREIVRAHGGRIELSSDPESGTRFAVVLPRNVAFAAEDRR